MSNAKQIEVLEYNPEWPKQYQAEADKILSILGEQVVNIYHIGSTSVPFLAAKKDLDILLVVKKLKESLALQDIGYVFKGELNVPLRYFFSKNTAETKVNLHVCEKTNGFVSLNLAFREWLQTHPEDREKYQALKYEILKSPDAGLKENGISNYSRRKNGFIKSILEKSGYQGIMINFCLHDSEWEAAKKFRNDSFLEELKSENHKHFVLYKGVSIIGYAHVELLPVETQKAIVHRMIIDEKERDKNYGSDFLRFIEGWLKFKGYKNLHFN